MDQRDDAPTKVLAFTAVFEPDPETGCIVVTFPAIPSLATQGENLDHARQMAVECLGAYLEHLQANGIPLPASEEHSTAAIREPIRIALGAA